MFAKYVYVMLYPGQGVPKKACFFNSLNVDIFVLLDYDHGVQDLISKIFEQMFNNKKIGRLFFWETLYLCIFAAALHPILPTSVFRTQPQNNSIFILTCFLLTKFELHIYCDVFC